MSVRAPTERNFRRARVKPTRRKAARRWFSWRLVRVTGASALAIYTCYRAAHLVVSADRLQVRRIEVRGNVRLSSGEIQALVDGLRGTNILTADLTEYRRRLTESPWVADVALRRVLPSTVEVFVSERRPMGLCRMGSNLYLIDERGTVIDEFGPQYADFDLPILDGLLRARGPGQPAIDEARADLAARALASLGARRELAQRVSQIDVSDPHNAIVLLDNDPALLHLGEDKFLQRLQSYVDLADALRDRVPDIDYVDLRFDERVYVRPARERRDGPDRRSPAARKF